MSHPHQTPDQPPIRPPTRARWNWPHLLLLAAWLPWWQLTRAGADAWALQGWLAAVLTVLGLAERYRPFRADWQPGRADLERDAGLWAVNSLVDTIAGAGLLWLALSLSPADSTWPLWLQILLGIPLAEFGGYWLHRCSHRDGWLWRVHLLHHRPVRVNLANSLTAHPLNALLERTVRLLPLLLLGMQADAILAIGLFHLMQSLAVHSNTTGSLGALGHLIGNAELHRVHHSDQPADDGNYGTDLPLWDQLFGTFRRPATSHSVGVYEPDRYPGEHAVLALLLLPWQRRDSTRQQNATRT
jgi:sterol desaturase/sphingolipid hydroxylase (fatty acid hydroxylase superfamily)